MPHRIKAGAASAPLAKGPTATGGAPFPVGPLPGPRRPMNPVTDAEGGALALLKLEAEIRAVGSERDLGHLIANETPRFTRARQVLVVSLPRKGEVRVVAVTSHPAVDRESPFIQAMERIVAAHLGRGAAGGGGIQDIAQELLAKHGDTALASYPFRYLLWVPLARSAADPPARGMVLAREIPWSEADGRIAGHLAGAYAFAWQVVDGSGRQALAHRLGRALNRRRVALGCAVLALSAGAIPVPMTALAPLEIGPRAPFVVAAPLDGVIDDVLVEPNARVRRGDALLRLVDTALRNRRDVAEREVQVAEARLKKFRQLAFDDPRGRHELAISAAELEARTAERDSAAELLSRAIVRATRDGVALFADRRDLVGRPAAVGERLMDIADPDEIELRADLSIGDAIVLGEGARVRGYLDADPFRPIEARIKRFDFQARATPSGALAYRIVAEIEPGPGPRPRLGARGTAQIHSNPVPLAFYLFRRPLAALRQWVGW